MAIDPAQLAGGVSQGNALGATQLDMPPQAGAPSPVVPGGPVDPTQVPPGATPGMMPPAPPPAPPPKPPTLLPTDVGRLLAGAINNAKMEAAHGLANYLGDPRGAVSTKNADLLRIWRKRNPDIDPLYEKLINKKSDDEIMLMMYPLRRALIRYGRRTYTEQVEFAEYMAGLNLDPRYDDLDNVEDEDDPYIPPQSKFPSRGEEHARKDLQDMSDREADQ